MDGNNTKVSFIPKGSLIREEAFLERRRPRSVIGVLAVSLFVLTVGSYIGLRSVNASISDVIAVKKVEIEKAQKEFSDVPEVEEAKTFRARADIARALLDAHTAVSPVIDFLSKYTVQSIVYSKFSFEQGMDGLAVVIAGEAPTYSALAYQGDVFKDRTKELSGFLVEDVSLTKFGTVTFNMKLVFTPSYLLYANSLGATALDEVPAAVSVPAKVETPLVDLMIPALTSTSISTSTSTSTSTTLQIEATEPILSGVEATSTEGTSLDSTANDWTIESRDVAETVSVPQPTTSSFWGVLWSRFKFW